MPHFRNGPVAPGIAFVTGGARGLGNAIAVSFAKDGAKGIALVDIADDETFKSGKEAVEKYGAKCITIHANVTKEDEIERAVAEAVKEFGRIDYAANFAGILGELGPTHSISFAGYLRAHEVNNFGVWLSMRAELKQMLTQDPLEEGRESGRVDQRGAIINCASVNSIQGAKGTTPYTASKHAVVGMTKAAALEYRGEGVRINCVSPGFLRTKLIEPVMEGLRQTLGGKGEDETKATEEDAWEKFEKRQGRKATSFEEVGDVVVLMCSQRMSLVVGQNLSIDGGFTINEGDD